MRVRYNDVQIETDLFIYLLLQFVRIPEEYVSCIFVGDAFDSIRRRRCSCFPQIPGLLVPDFGVNSFCTECSSYNVWMVDASQFEIVRQ
jgi:hypothetical protein